MKASELLKEIVRDEKVAPDEYKRLLPSLNTNDRMKVLRIIKEEKRHFKEVKSFRIKK